MAAIVLPFHAIANARQGPTLFPIVFTAIVAKALRSVAAFKLVHGSSVLTIEYLLASRTVFNAIMAPISLRAFNALTPMLVVLWAISPMGGQASLRVIFTTQSPINITAAISYLNYSSPFINEGMESASGSSLDQTNAIFTSALISTASSKAAGQDEFGNMKIPMIESLIAATSDTSNWTDPGSKDIVYSSLAGLPYLGAPDAGTTRFNVETSYMYANCSLTHSPLAGVTPSYANTTPPAYLEYYNGENYLLLWDGNTTFTMTPGHQYWVKFKSVGGSEYCAGTALTTAECNLTMTYVEVAMECTKGQCSSTRIRQSQLPHKAANLVPLAGSANTDDSDYTYYWPDFINSTYTQALCDDSCCSSSPIEAYLLDPDSPYSISESSPPIWPIGDKLFSQRFSQLLNTYWIASVAPVQLLGNFTIPSANESDLLMSSYKVSNTTAQVERVLEVIRCSHAWLAVLLVASVIMLLVGVIGACLNMCRKGPEILDSFSALLRNDICVGVEHDSSMESTPEQVRRLRHVRIRLGDIRPEDDVGFVSIAPLGPDRSVKKLSDRRLYG